MSDVSVIIPCYKGAAFIAQTLESVLAQTQPVREVIVVDDGSTDDSAAIIERFEQSSGGVVSLLRQPNSGESRARNVAMAQAVGHYIALLDADDLWLPEKTAVQTALLDARPDLVGCYTRVFDFTVELDDRQRLESQTTRDDLLLEDLVMHHHIAPSSVMLRRSVLIEHGIAFNERVRHAEDMLFFCDVRLAGAMAMVDQPLVAKRVHAGQQTKNPLHTFYSIENRVRWLRDHSERIDPRLFARLEASLAAVMIKTLEDRYWRRQFDGFDEARRRTERLFPDLLGASAVARRRVWPRWVYTLRDRLGGR